MDAKKMKNLIEAIKLFGEQKQISKEELHHYLVEVFKKAFNKLDVSTQSNLEILPAEIIVDLDLEKGEINLKRRWTVSSEVEPENINIHLLVENEKIRDKNLQVGDIFEEEIDLLNLDSSKIQHIRQLLTQKTREAEKLKLYESFIDKKGKILSASVYKVTDNYIILDYEGVSIFMPKTEYTSSDRFVVGKPKTVYILEVEKISKDAQVIASRNHPEFVRKILEREIEDVSDGVIEILNIAREPGVKTKVVVTSHQEEVDPIGSIIGVKGQRIKNIINELNGERIDIIKHSSDFSELVSNVLVPGKIEGLKVISKNEETGKTEQIIAIVSQDNFLPTIGKRGVNVKLASRLLSIKIDVKTVQAAKEANIEWEPIDILDNRRFKRNKSDINSELLEGVIDDYDFQDIIAIAEESDDDFNEMDYMLNDDQNQRR